MRLVRCVLIGVLVASLASCSTPSNKHLFGRQKKKGPNLAGSTAALTLPSHLSSAKIKDYYKVNPNVARVPPSVSLVPPGSNLPPAKKRK